MLSLSPASRIKLAMMMRVTTVTMTRSPSPTLWPSFSYAGRALGCIRTISTSASPRDDLLRGVSADNREDVARVLEQAERALDSWEVQSTAFYSPPVVAEAMMALQRLADVVAVPWGGYSQAERCRISIGREEALGGAVAEPAAHLDSVAALKVSGNFLFDPATHRDFLGACLGTGIERTVVGDILVQGDTGALILIAPSMLEHLEASLAQVRTVPVKARRMALTDLRVPAPKSLEMSSVEASLRVDAIGSAGFRMSRSKMAELIKGGEVRVNWKVVAKTSVDVAAGDVISCSGKGRLEIKAVTLTKKGKWAVEMVRFT